MSDHASRPVERHCDVAVIGGSAAGLAAAMQLGRQRRSVIVVDAGEARNAPAAHVHGYPGREGTAPAALVTHAREEVRSYGGEILSGRVTSVARTEGGFRVGLEGGALIAARRVLAATGLVDELPGIEGLARHWGRDVIHCPFCHGYEARGRRIVQIVSHPVGIHTAGLFRHLSDRLTVIVAEDAGVDRAQLGALEAAGVCIRPGRATSIIAGADGHVAAVEVDGTDRIEADAIVIAPRFAARLDPLLPLGVRPAAHPSGLGDFLETDAAGKTSQPGVYAAGNVTDPTQQVLQAAADGSRVGAMISFDLADEDVRQAARIPANQVDWDHRYSGERLWSGNPNGALVAEVDGLSPGRVLDVGAGEGGDALWLAEQGWAVTANDISPQALSRIRAEAGRRGMEIECRQADANALAPFGTAAFDLVSAQYASIPRSADGRAVRNLMGAVAPGGTLLVVSHDLEPMRPPLEGSGHGRPFDPDAYVRVEDFVEALAGSPGWEIAVHEKRPRPAGAASASHHVDDIVLRARRLPTPNPPAGAA